MTFCELCGSEVYRRVKVGKLLVCWHCASLLKKPKTEIVKEAMHYYGMMREHNTELLKIRNRPSYGSVYAAIPSKDVLQRAVIALEVSGSYQPFFDVLAEVYGIESPLSYFNPSQVSDGSIACYHPSTHTIYSKTKKMKRRTAFHEFWHALEGKRRVVRYSSKVVREKNANDYAEACMRIIMS